MSEASEFEQLLSEYAGTIRAGVPEHADRMRGLLERWNPEGKPVYELKALAGMPSSERAGEVAYLFDDGYGGGGAWLFEVDDGVVTEWSTIPMH